MGLWTAEDIEKLRAAIVRLASGEAVQTVSFNGPPQRTVVYHAADLDKMRALLSEMTRDVQGVTTFRRAQFSKGFR